MPSQRKNVKFNVEHEQVEFTLSRDKFITITYRKLTFILLFESRHRAENFRGRDNGSILSQYYLKIMVSCKQQAPEYKVENSKNNLKENLSF